MNGFWLVLIFTFSLHSIIFELPHFREMTHHLKEEDLVILDIDDTLLIPTQMLGCDEWFQYRYKEHLKEMSQREALEKALAEWEAIRHLTKMEIVEPGTDALIQELQNAGHCIMGLTTQGLALATRTSKQLTSHQIDLQLTAPSQEDHYFTIGGHGVLYRHGILFTSGTSKGESLFALCNKIGYSPKRIVFVNDKLAHLKDIEEVAEEKGVEFMGLRYGFSDARKRAFSPAIANYQFTHSTFEHILSDDEAIHSRDLSCILHFN